MARSDFAWIPFFEDFNSGNTVATRPFQIEGTPFGDGYLLIQQFDVEVSTHRIQINGTDLPGLDLTPMPPGNPDRVWLTWMDRIPPDILRSGANRLTIRRSEQTDEFFAIANVAVHWRELG